MEERGEECTSSTICEEVLRQSVIRTINLAIGGKKSFLATLQQNISTVLDKWYDMNTESIDAKLDDLQNELLLLANPKNQNESVAAEIYTLQEMKQVALTQNTDRQTKRQCISEMKAFLNSQTDIGSHIECTVSYITGLKIESVCANLQCI